MKIFLLALGLLALPGCTQLSGGRATAAAGATEPASPPVSFLEADLDRDARISRREFELWLREPAGADGFDALDTNRDGVLTLDEWQTMLRAPSAAAGASARSRTPPSR